MNGEYVTVDIKKAKHYFSLAANQKYRDVQLILDKLNLIDKNSSLNIDSEIIFESAFLLHERKYTIRNIQESISLYKKLSSLNNQYAKNNLGIIYKNGYGEEISKNVNNAIVYFEEAISQKNDYLSMYNLAHIYLFSETVKHDINKSIDLLIKSSKKFTHSFNLLCILLIKQFGFNDIQIKREMEKHINEKENSDILTKICKLINSLKYYGMS